MISHNTEIPQAEMELPLCLSDEREKQPLELGFKKAHVVMVNLGRDMVGCSILEYTQTSHTSNKSLAGELLLPFRLFYQKVSDTPL
jgi:hypothetical protein